MMTEIQLAKAEEAIEQLADALDVTPAQVIKYLEHGFDMESPNSGQLPKSQLYFLNEMKSTFDCL